jgi:plasmid maintenance system killer protein
MEFRIEKEDVLQKIIQDKKRKTLRSDYHRVLDIFHAAPDFEILPNIHHLDLRKDDLKKDHYSVRLDQTSRLSLKKLSKDCICLLAII